MPSPARRAALVTLGCARNEVDSEELAGRLAADGWQVGAGEDDADIVLVNTCAFVASAKKDSVDTLLAAADGGRPVVAVGCLAERYGAELADSLPEASAVLGFDAYPEIGDRLDDVLAGRPPVPHTPRDRRTLLPVTPARRPAAAGSVAVPGHGAPGVERVQRGPGPYNPVDPADPEVPPEPADPPDPGAPADPDDPTRPPGPTVPAGIRPAGWAPPVLRRRLDDSPVAPLKLASGCDRRCSFCAIPSFRGAFVSRPPGELLAEARWLADRGVRELVLVSENSTSYGKDLGDLRLLEALLPELAAVPGIVRVRLSYLQPAETRPSLIEAIATTPGVAAYYDLSFQHASEEVLRRMRRFGGTARFLALLDQVRATAPAAGVRSNVIVGFPGETRADVAELTRFLTAARLDAVGVFGYSDEDGTEAAAHPGKLRRDVVDRRAARMSRLVEELMAQRAEERIGETVEVLLESVGGESVGGESVGGESVGGESVGGESVGRELMGGPDAVEAEGRAAHQAPEVDGLTTVLGLPVFARPGDLVRARVTGSAGVDLTARYLETVDAAGEPVAAPARIAAGAGRP